MHSRHPNLIYRVYNQLGTTTNILNNLTTGTTHHTTGTRAQTIIECCHQTRRRYTTKATVAAATATSRHHIQQAADRSCKSNSINEIHRQSVPFSWQNSTEQHHQHHHRHSQQRQQHRYFNSTATTPTALAKTQVSKRVTSNRDDDEVNDGHNILEYRVDHRAKIYGPHDDILSGDHHRLNTTRTSFKQSDEELYDKHESNNRATESPPDTSANHGRRTEDLSKSQPQDSTPTEIEASPKQRYASHTDKNRFEAKESENQETKAKTGYVCKHALKHMQALPFKSIPGPSPSLPLVGTNWIYFPIIGRYKSMKLHEANMDKYHRYGPIMKEEYQRGYPTVTIFEPSDIKEVFTREGACPSRPVLPYVIKHRKSDPSRYPNVGLANMEGPEWFELRSRLAPLLLSRELKKRHINTQNRVSSRLVNYIKSLLPANQKTGEVNRERDNDLNGSSNSIGSNSSSSGNQNSGIVNNIQEVFYRFSMESIMNSCINQELGCLKATNGLSNVDSATKATTRARGDSFNAESSEGELIFRAAMDFFEAQHKLYYGLGLWKYIESEPYRQLCDSENSIHDIASKYIDAALVHLKRKHEARDRSKGSMGELPTEEHESLLETLYCTNKFTDLEIKSTIVDFVGGGIYTVANTLTMCLFLLASNPSVQEQLYQEICQVFEESYEIGSDITIDMEKLEQMKFLKLCLKESYRLLPTIPGVARTLQRDTVLSNYLVPKNTLVFCNFMVTCRLPQYFANPDEYNPNRWQRDGSIKNDLAFCLLPFGHGVRKCIGHNFAELEIYVALAKLIRSFKIKTLNGENAKSLDLCYKFIVVPEKPVKLEFTPRR